ncbi:MAG TPA: diacylglycerol kinase family protein [Streptosporangiaceae bacterium]|nr:diacylglycerol kinase family protein [Streptosporangiaceae bacterium]
MRGLLIVNQHATSMTGTVADLAIRSLSGLVDLDVERTRYRGHARDLAATADAGLIIVHGGDGSINEAVNGVMSRDGAGGLGTGGLGAGGLGAGGLGAGPQGRPLIAIIPGGGANVLARGLGLPVDAAAAIRRLRESLAAGRYRTIGLGLAGDRYFTFSAGLGWDAEVVGEVDRLRAEGHRESATLFLRTMVRSYYRSTDRRRPALTLERDGEPPVSDLFMTIITNRSPWTYLHSRAVLPVPNPDFSSGLDLLAMRRLRLVRIVSAVGQMLYIRGRTPRGRDLMSVLGSESLAVRSSRPIALQVDGEYLGETEAVKFQFVPHALRIVT